MWRATLKSLLAKKIRLLLTALAIVLGVGFVAGTYVLTDTMNAAFEDLFEQSTVGLDLVVRGENAFQGGQAGGGGGVDERPPISESLLSDVMAVPGVAAAAGDVAGYAQMVNPDTDEVIGGIGPPTIGLNWNELSSGVVEMREGEPPDGGGEVAVDAAAANANDLQIGERIRILFQGPPEEFEIVGIVGFGEADNLMGATLVIFETETAQRVLGKQAVFDSISVRLDEGASIVGVREALASSMPEGVEVITAETLADEQTQTFTEGLGFFRTALFVFAAIALFVGSFLIFNTFSIIVAQRTRELALLRSLGASRGQVMVSVVFEALLVGFVASVVGVIAGVGIAEGLQAMLGSFGMDLPDTPTKLQPRTFIASLIVGLGVTVVASVVPARHAARVPPIQALREQDSLRTSGRFGRRALAGGVAAVAGLAALVIGLFFGPPDPATFVGLGAALVFIAIAILSPLVARRVAGAIGAPLRRGGVQARLGRENAMRNPRRTASTAAALTIGLGLVAMVTILAASMKASFDVALIETMKADFTLSTSSFMPFSPDVAEQVDELDVVDTVSAFRTDTFRVGDDTVLLTAVDTTTVEAVATIQVSEGALGALAGDAVMVHRPVAEERGWAVGDQIPSAFATVGERPLTIVGIFDENRLVGSDYVISMATHEQYFVERLDGFVLVKGAEGVPPEEVKAAIEEAVSEYPNIDVQDQVEFREKQAGFIDQLLGLITALLLMAIFIALFGIVNTLGLTIYERTRELGLLRAVGMSRTQVKRMIRWESVIIALFGALMGIVVGIGFGWVLQQSLADEGFTELSIPAGQLAIYVVFAALAGVVAAIWPARKAARLNILEAIAYE